MKQFNLEEYLRLKKEGKEPKIVTMDGHSARIVCTDMKLEDYPVLALFIDSHDEEETLNCTASGRFYLSDEHKFDLFFADLNPEPTYRPYKDMEECFKDVIKHGGWVKDKHAIRNVSQITFKEPQGLVDDIVQIRGCNGRTYKEFLKDFTYADDGSPCGVKEDE